MSTTFILLVAAGAVLRALLSRALQIRFGLTLSVPPVITGGLLLLALLPGWLSPLAFPLPLGLMLGALLPDILLRRLG
ncbi:hypothetical protein CEW88_04475 [Alloyangia pacifica]|uniref:Uncharacterized protein n=1 Tax=Alloyangia pacifica TaxID=311180 RepID=A0A2U8HB33_9RHOB|nr:hypothetical protein CEW88_04475 [Alloyangia pacifica]